MGKPRIKIYGAEALIDLNKNKKEKKGCGRSLGNTGLKCNEKDLCRKCKEQDKGENGN